MRVNRKSCAVRLRLGGEREGERERERERERGKQLAS